MSTSGAEASLDRTWSGDGVAGGPAGWAVAAAVAACWLAAVGLVLVHGATRPLPWLNHDVAFHALVGRELLDGARLYVDVRDTNPPGSQFLLAAVVGLARASSAPLIVMLLLVPLAFGAAGLWLLAATVRRAAPGTGTALAGALAAVGYLLVIVPGNFANDTLPHAARLPYDFGQREHLFALLLLPYLVWRLSASPRAPGPRGLAAYLVLLGAVSMFKPYWPPMLAAVELWAWRTGAGGARRVLPALAVGLALPPLLLLLHSPAAWLTFITEVVPWHLQGDYAHYGMGWLEFAGTALHARIVAGLGVIAAALVVARQRRAAAPATLALLVGLVALAYLSLVHQHKFWSYHAMPLFALVVCGAAWLAGRVMATVRAAGSRFAWWAAATLLLLAAAGTGLDAFATLLARQPAFGSHLVGLVDGRRSVMVFSMSVDYSYAPLRAGTPLVGPWTVHFELPPLLQPNRRQDLDAYVSSVRARIEAAGPELLLFSPSTQALPGGATLHDLLAVRGAVPRDDYDPWSPARLAAVDPSLRGWVVYSRREGVPR